MPMKKILERVKISHLDFEKIISAPGKNVFIFLDPPYEQRLIEITLKIIGKGEILRDSGVLIAEHSIREPVESHYEALVLKDQRRYGSTLLSFFRPMAQTNSITQGPVQHGS